MLVGSLLRGGVNFPAYLSSHFSHLYSDFWLDFSSGSSCFLAALSSAPPPPAPVSSSPSLSSFRPSAPCLSAPPTLPTFSGSSVSSFAPSSRFPAPPVASVSSAASPIPSHPVSSLPQAPSLAPPVSFPFGASRRLPSGAPGLPQVASLPRVPGSSWAAFAPAVPVRPFAPAPSFFRPFASVPSSSVPVSSTPPPVTSSGPPPFSSSSFAFDSSSAPPDPSSSFSFGLQDDLLEDAPPDTLPHVLDPVASALPESAWSEFHLTMAFIVDLFPQSAGSPSVPPPRALFEDFFSSSVPPPPPIFLNWFERIHSALADADSCLASFVASGRGAYLFLPSCSSTYAVHGDFALGGAAPVNSSLLSLFEWRLKPTHHGGLTIREAAALPRNCVEQCGSRSAGEGSHGTGSFISRLLQLPVCYPPQGHRVLAAGNRPLQPQPFCASLPFSHGDGSVSSPVSLSGRLDGVPGAPGRLPSGSGASVILALPEVLLGGFGPVVSGSLLRPFDCSAGVHTRHGPYLFHHALLWVPDPMVSGRLARPGILISRDSAGEGLSSLALSTSARAL